MGARRYHEYFQSLYMFKVSHGNLAPIETILDTVHVGASWYSECRGLLEVLAAKFRVHVFALFSFPSPSPFSFFCWGKGFVASGAA
jgi:hypothetical protein